MVEATPAIYEIDPSIGRAVIDTGSRTVEVSYYWHPDDHGYADLDGSEALEWLDADEPLGHEALRLGLGSVVPDSDPRLVAVPVLLDRSERDLCESLIADWHRADEAGDGPDPDPFFPGEAVRS